SRGPASSPRMRRKAASLDTSCTYASRVWGDSERSRAMKLPKPFMALCQSIVANCASRFVFIGVLRTFKRRTIFPRRCEVRNLCPALKMPSMNVFSKLFASFDNQDVLVFLIFLLVAFLFGYLLSWAVGSRRTARAREEAQKAAAELKALDAEYQSFKEQFALREADLQHAQIESEDNKRQTL